MGSLFEAYERLKAQLASEGVFDAERKHALPPHPQTIGIVTSTATAALRDIVSTLKRRMSSLKVIVYPTAVQGKGSEFQIAKAINTASERNEVDVLLVCRGGGSIEDLWAFNEEVVVRAIAACNIPVVSGVGHETDVTLSDFVADVRAPTPTGAAELVSPDVRVLRQRIHSLQAASALALQRRYQDLSQRIDWYARQLKHPSEQIKAQGQQILQKQQQIRYSFQNYMRAQQQNLLWQHTQLHASAPNIKHLQHNLSQTQKVLHNSWLGLKQQQEQRLHKQIALLEALSPQHVLQRGFSVVKNHRGQVVSSASEVRFGQHINIIFHDSEAAAQITLGSAQQDLFD